MIPKRLIESAMIMIFLWCFPGVLRSLPSHPVRDINAAFVAQVADDVSFKTNGDWQRVRTGMWLPEKAWIKFTNSTFTLLKANSYCHKDHYSAIIKLSQLPFKEKSSLIGSILEMFSRFLNEPEEKGAPALGENKRYRHSPGTLPASGELSDDSNVVVLHWRRDTGTLYHLVLKAKMKVGPYPARQDTLLLDTVVDVNSPSFRDNNGPAQFCSQTIMVRDSVGLSYYHLNYSRNKAGVLRMDSNYQAVLRHLFRSLQASPVNKRPSQPTLSGIGDEPLQVRKRKRNGDQ